MLEHFHSSKYAFIYLAIMHFAIYRWKIFFDAKVGSLYKANRVEIF